MASEKLLKELNDQFNFEISSAYYYMGMAAYCSDKNMNGFANFFVAQAKEEYSHAMKFYEFIYDMDGRVRTQAIAEPKNDYNSFLEVFEEALKHEKLVTSKIHKLLEIAEEEKSYPTIQFLQWFVEEQLEEENSMKDIIFNLEGIKDNFQGLYLLDKELGARQ
ncbi:ferritin [Tissierella praeacuta]|uniref:Ferritin n=1 Tax=Tissierella praeacuta DSM 18095 TaxID=1123404 RepID=A0A1M4YDU2_9FIRM|nr:ferritin [Tissierella praeacuta]MBU5256272.1 ferritin [Tissierella praeacuta]TCU74200.1 ferritin [Tissierella praeacuta]SHF03642.1 ferritin [Tissierella praeacuta DSM 18095]SUP03171.1 Ferritin [Tissierella praeacuta]